MKRFLTFYCVNMAIGFGVAIVLVGALWITDTGSLRTLVQSSDSGRAALFGLAMMIGLTFGVAQVGFAAALSSSNDEDK